MRGWERVRHSLSARTANPKRSRKHDAENDSTNRVSVAGSEGRVSAHPRKGGFMYIGIGTLVVILIILAIIYFARRA